MPRLIALWIALLACLGVPAWAAPSFPPLTGRVVDAANVIPADAEARIDRKLTKLEAQSHRQLVVATLPSLQGNDIADYGYQLGRAWGIGSRDKNDGALLIVAPSERKVRIEVGYGLEGTLTDGLSSLIIAQQIVPRFKAGDVPGGIEAGVDAIAHQLGLPPEEAMNQAFLASSAVRMEPTESSGGDWDGFWLTLLVLGGTLVICLGIAVVAHLLQGPQPRGKGAAARRKREEARSSWSSGSRSSPPRSFAGGGGSFGGGGASGSW